MTERYCCFRSLAVMLTNVLTKTSVKKPRNILIIFAMMVSLLSVGSIKKSRFPYSSTYRSLPANTTAQFQWAFIGCFSFKFQMHLIWNFPRLQATRGRVITRPVYLRSLFVSGSNQVMPSQGHFSAIKTMEFLQALWVWRILTTTLHLRSTREYKNRNRNSKIRFLAHRWNTFVISSTHALFETMQQSKDN